MNSVDTNKPKSVYPSKGFDSVQKGNIYLVLLNYLLMERSSIHCQTVKINIQLYVEAKLIYT